MRFNMSVFAAVPVLVKFRYIPPFTETVPEPVRTNDNPCQLKFPVLPVWNVTPATADVTMAVLDVTVKLVVVGASHAVSVPVIVIALAPNVIVLILELDKKNFPHEHVCPFVFSVPAVNVTVEVDPTVLESESK